MNELKAYADELAIWQEATFGLAPPEPSIAHLLEEVIELAKSPYDPMEYADCFMLILAAHRRAGGTIEGLLAAARLKLVINQKRKWGEPDENGVVHHIPED